MMTSSEIREKFLEFFRSKGHAIVPSAPIVVKNDPTLLFTNAGMNQFKDYFLGNKKPPHPRVADTQKCLRVSGKHNDLEEVGVDTYHHTMFEMLGNWSFGDYFKKEAIAWSWELLTTVYQLPKDRLYVTVFEGDSRESLPRDEEAFQEWKNWIPEDRIIQGNKKDNFWEMGDTGPCGPCTEIHVDCRTEEQRSQVEGKALVNRDHPQVIEIWNNVFIQFNRLRNGVLEPLPSRHVDTGLGLERLVRVLQQKQSNYDTDLFSGIIAVTEKITGKNYDPLSMPASKGKSWSEAVAFRVIADHIRAIAFCIADGQLPSNTGAGYVIRRILRRAVRYYYSGLEYRQPLLHLLIPPLASQFETVFPELQKQADFVAKVVAEEEEAFLRTLDKGLRKIDEVISSLSSGNRQTGVISGREVFELFDTYGFPLDLTRLIASESHLLVDEAGFDAEMKKQKERSRAATAVDTEDWVVLVENPLLEFVGYDSVESKTKIARYRKIRAKGKEAYQLVLEATPFYAESGGQVGDTGILEFDGETIEVLDTKKENDVIVHFTGKLPADLQAELLAKVDLGKRKRTEIHHSATHLLHAALRRVLGNHVTQKGSLVNAEHLRFDFSHFAKLSDEDLKRVEELVNEKIRDNILVVIREMPREEALRMGAMALFGEKYGDLVRVVIMDQRYSVELCGGTHVESTGTLGYFKIKQETAVAAGVRRVEAVGGPACEKFIEEQFTLLKAVQDSLRGTTNPVKAIESLYTENSELKKKIESMESRQLQAMTRELLGKVQHIDGYQFIGEQVDVSNPDALKKLCFDLKGGLNNYLVVLTAAIDGKASVAVMLDEQLALARNLEAPRIIRERIAPLIKGGGGGQKTLATAGGLEVAALPAVIAEVRSLL